MGEKKSKNKKREKIKIGTGLPEIADRSSPPAENRKDRRGEHPKLLWGNQNKDMAGGKQASLLFVAVLGALVMGSAIGGSGKEKMDRFESQSDVSGADRQMVMHLQVTPPLRTDSVANSISTHDSATHEGVTR
jgi:hypothetical protein